MIKINLAAKKQATYLGSEAGAGKAFSAEDMKDLPLVKIGLTIIVAFVAMTVAKGIMRKELMAEDMKLKTLVQETVKLQAEVSKTDGFKEIQAQLEADELLIKSKIDTIEELAEKRRNLKKVMLSISEVIPPMVWLTDLNLAEKNITIKGLSTDLVLVSQFMRDLEESSLMKAIVLDTTEKFFSPDGVELTRFHLKAERTE